MIDWASVSHDDKLALKDYFRAIQSQFVRNVGHAATALGQVVGMRSPANLGMVSFTALGPLFDRFAASIFLSSWERLAVSLGLRPSKGSGFAQLESSQSIMSSDHRAMCITIYNDIGYVHVQT